VSDLKATASRENGKKSTGPVTEEGRAKSSRNATKLGIFSQARLLEEESAAEFEALLDALILEQDAVGVLEIHYVSEIAKGMWRKWRLARAETAAIQKERASILYASPDLQWTDLSPTLLLRVKGFPEDVQSALAQVREDLAIASRTIPKNDEKFHRVAVSLDKEIERAVRGLREAQACRRSLVSPASERSVPSTAKSRDRDELITEAELTE
jgi:hypothetical protein